VTSWSVGEDGSLTLTGSGAEPGFAPAEVGGSPGGTTGLIGTTWTLTGNSYVNELNVADCSKIIYGGHTLFYQSFASGSAICSSPNLQLY
jgi:hypothetical protein